MNSQIVSTTDVQRNFKKVLTKLQISQEPLLVVRDSQPAAVMLSYPEYQRLADLEKSILKIQMESILEGLSSVNKDVSDKELNADIAKARRYAPRRR